MNHHNHNESTIHLLATIGFFALCAILIVWPAQINTNIALGILAGLLGLKTIGNLIIDTHRKMKHKHWAKSSGMKSQSECCGGW